VGGRKGERGDDNSVISVWCRFVTRNGMSPFLSLFRVCTQILVRLSNQQVQLSGDVQTRLGKSRHSGEEGTGFVEGQGKKRNFDGI
jgi:hypothetical protein